MLYRDVTAAAEKALIWQVVKRAVLDAAGLAGLTKWERRQFQCEAKVWIFSCSPDDHKYPFTFTWCCIELDMSPVEVRRHVREALDRKTVGHGLNRHKATGIGAFFADVAESPTQAEVYFL